MTMAPIYRISFPTQLISGVGWNWRSAEFDSVQEVRDYLKKHIKREYAKKARLFRITEEEIDIDKEDW